ncbi:MAG: hypothetical protein ACI9VN_000892 [Patescibacteria group bacterium]|jgi:hypothetical protein
MDSQKAQGISSSGAFYFYFYFCNQSSNSICPRIKGIEVEVEIRMTTYAKADALLTERSLFLR